MRSVVPDTPIVPILARTAPGRKPAPTPSSRRAPLTISAVGSIVITTCASRTASATDAATEAPALKVAPVADFERSQTVVGIPAATRLRAIAEPMMPLPITATPRMGSSVSHAHLAFSRWSPSARLAFDLFGPSARSYPRASGGNMSGTNCKKSSRCTLKVSAGVAAMTSA